MTLSRCVVFDLDDTLFLERDYVRSGFEAAGHWARRHLGIDGLAAAAWAAFTRGVRGRTFQVALEACGADPTPEVVAGLVEAYRSHPPAIAPLDDARACIAALRGRAVLAVVSDGPLASQRAKAAAMGADSWAEVVVLTAAEGPEWAKPQGRAFAFVEERTGLDGPCCAYVADNPAKDFLGPRSRGWVTVRVRRPGSLHEEVPSGPDVDADHRDLATVPGFLEAWLSVQDGERAAGAVPPAGGRRAR